MMEEKKGLVDFLRTAVGCFRDLPRGHIINLAQHMQQVVPFISISSCLHGTKLNCQLCYVVHPEQQHALSADLQHSLPPAVLSVVVRKTAYFFVSNQCSQVC